MIVNATVTGFSHIVAGKECQDYSLTWQDRSGSISIAAVSDGHGGEEYINSAVGARVACEVAVEVLREFAAGAARIPRRAVAAMAPQIARSILAEWHEKVNFESVRSFGCTLIACLQTPSYWIALQIGDGKFAMLSRAGEWSQPVPWDDRCILNFTTSMCDEDAIDNFRYAVGSGRARAFFMSSDGIDGTFADGDLLYNFYDRILQTARGEGPEALRHQLPQVLSHFSEAGSRDDMSLAAIIND